LSEELRLDEGVVLSEVTVSVNQKVSLLLEDLLVFDIGRDRFRNWKTVAVVKNVVGIGLDHVCRKGELEVHTLCVGDGLEVRSELDNVQIKRSNLS